MYTPVNLVSGTRRLSKMNQAKLMAIGAHADDIELNVGGSLCKYRELGYEVIYIMSTNNMSGCWKTLLPDGRKEVRKPPYNEMMPQRKKEAAAAAKFFGTVAIHLDHPQRHYTDKDGNNFQLRYGNPCPDCVAPDTPTILTAHEDKNAVQRLTDLILEYQPEAVITHGPAMVDMEHMGTALLVTKAYRKAVEAGYNGMLLHWLDNNPTIFGDAFCQWDAVIDVSNYWEQKLEAIGKHACQMPDTSCLTFVPWGDTCGYKHAEAFTIGGQGKLSQENSPFYQEIIKSNQIKPIRSKLTRK